MRLSNTVANIPMDNAISGSFMLDTISMLCSDRLPGKSSGLPM